MPVEGGGSKTVSHRVEGKRKVSNTLFPGGRGKGEGAATFVKTRIGNKERGNGGTISRANLFYQRRI